MVQTLAMYTGKHQIVHKWMLIPKIWYPSFSPVPYPMMSCFLSVKASSPPSYGQQFNTGCGRSSWQLRNIHCAEVRHRFFMDEELGIPIGPIINHQPHQPHQPQGPGHCTGLQHTAAPHFQWSPAICSCNAGHTTEAFRATPTCAVEDWDVKKRGY